MSHTHEYDCIVCGAHFDDERSLQSHNSESHKPKQAIDVHAPAEPMGTERPRNRGANNGVASDKAEINPSALQERRTPRYGSAGSGGAEFEPGPRD